MNRQELEKKLIELLQNPDNEEATKMLATFSGYLQQLSNDISDVITPLNKFNANFVVALLEAYAQSIRQSMPCDDEIIEKIKGFNTGKIMMVMPTDLMDREDKDE
ncbi:MAG: hypothetical protein IKY33_01575 [Clostridia bacterium]|nr:hypothetical protein [Clostridia bacterium]